ncbi:MAG: site-specific integrase [Actinomycetota bacterium]|nr:site-specific integrase [Actinomycetota bacterium]
MARRKATFGSVRKLPSGRYQARYTSPDLVRRTAPVTFDTKGDAETWLALRRSEIARGTWRPASAVPTLTFGAYADAWLDYRTLKPRTAAHYRSLLDRHLLPTFANVALSAITPSMVRAWHTNMGARRPTLRAHAYSLLRAILTTAIEDEHLTANPCHIRGAGAAKRVHRIRPASLAELEKLVAAMPDRLQAMTLLAAWCGLRFGELTELRRKDVDLAHGLLRVRRGVVRVGNELVVGTPKTAAGIRDVAVPPHLLSVLTDHLRDHTDPSRDALLFPARSGAHLHPASLYGPFYRAREAAGRPDLRWHDLRHVSAVLAAQSGATLAELMHRLGHTTPAAAMKYQHAAEGRDQAIANALSALARGEVQ